MKLEQIQKSNEKSRVIVSVRIRPAISESWNAEKIVVEAENNNSIEIDDELKGKRKFKFDNVFIGGQESVYAALGRPMLEEAFKGFNVCLFAYGQTGSGKTYSIFGDTNMETSNINERSGIAPRFVHELFKDAQKIVESDEESLDLREDNNKKVFVKGLTVHPVLSCERMLELLKKGNSNRQTAETQMNETSSRSHAIIQITLIQETKSIFKKDLESTIFIVDLAGSERQSKSQAIGQHFEEAKKINQSLLMLGRALNSFSDRKSGETYISLRESKLTRLLSESFGGNSKTWMLATISPAAYNLTESVSTLEYASNAMAITNKVAVNKSAKTLEYNKLVEYQQCLHDEIEKESELIKHYDVDLSDLDNEINHLNRLLSLFSERQLSTYVKRELMKEQGKLLSKLNEIILSIEREDNEYDFLCLSSACEIVLDAQMTENLQVHTLPIFIYALGGPPPLLTCSSIVRELNDQKEQSKIYVITLKLYNLLYVPDYVTDGVKFTI